MTAPNFFVLRNPSINEVTTALEMFPNCVAFAVFSDGVTGRGLEEERKWAELASKYSYDGKPIGLHLVYCCAGSDAEQERYLHTLLSVWSRDFNAPLPASPEVRRRSFLLSMLENIKSARTIEAVKDYRSAFGCSLREARDAVVHYISLGPEKTEENLKKAGWV